MRRKWHRYTDCRQNSAGRRTSRLPAVASEATAVKIAPGAKQAVHAYRLVPLRSQTRASLPLVACPSGKRFRRHRHSGPCGSRPDIIQACVCMCKRQNDGHPEEREIEAKLHREEAYILAREGGEKTRHPSPYKFTAGERLLRNRARSVARTGRSHAPKRARGKRPKANERADRLTPANGARNNDSDREEEAAQNREEEQGVHPKTKCRSCHIVYGHALPSTHLARDAVKRFC